MDWVPERMLLTLSLLVAFCRATWIDARAGAQARIVFSTSQTSSTSVQTGRSVTDWQIHLKANVESDDRGDVTLTHLDRDKCVHVYVTHDAE